MKRRYVGLAVRCAGYAVALFVTALLGTYALATGVSFWLVALMTAGPWLAYATVKWGLKAILRYPVIVGLLVLLVGCSIAAAGKPKYQQQMENISNKIATQLTTAVPYPLAEMTDSLERRMLRERLLRFNKSTKTGYLYVFNAGIKDPIGYYVIKGKISSTESQLSNPDQTWDCGSDCFTSAQSIGDDGTFGPEEGGPSGVFFFDAQGVMHETTLWWSYSDAPIPEWQSAPQLSDASSRPSSTSSIWQKNGGLGGG